jgi:hypothetical protein
MLNSKVRSLGFTLMDMTVYGTMANPGQGSPPIFKGKQDTLNP